MFADPNATPKVLLSLGVMVLWGLVRVHVVSAAMVQLLRVETDHALKTLVARPAGPKITLRFPCPFVSDCVHPHLSHVQ